MTKKPVLKLPPFGEPMDRSFVAMDAEWAPDRSLLTLGFADTIRAIAVDKDLMARLNPAIVQIPLWLGGHNVPGDLDYLVALGLAKSEWVEGTKLLDSYILAKLVNENLGSKKVDGKGPYNLQRLLQRVFEVENWKAESESFDPKDATTWPPDVRVNRCARDAWASARLIQHLVPRVAPPFLRYAHRLMMTLHRVFLTGVCVDTGALDSLGAGWRAEVVRARELVERAAAQHRMRAFSVTKPADVRRLVYKKLKIPVTRRTAKGRLPAVDKITLGQHKANPVVKHLLDFRRADKLLGSWYGSDNPKSKAIPLVRLLEKPGPRRGTAWLRAVLNPFAARTGRRSSGGKNDRDEQFGKNMQNWPPVARTMIVSRYKGGEILSVDYSKLEVVLFAWRARDRKLFDYFYSGSGYIGIAEEMFGKKVEKDTPLYTVAKSTVLACQYGAEDFKFAEQLWFKLGVRLAKDWETHLRKAGKIRRRYLRLFPGIERYMRQCKHEMASTGRVEIVPGYFRHLPGYNKIVGEDTKWRRKHMVNEAVNAPVQGLASVVTGSAAIDTEAALCRANGLSVLQHHENLLKGVIDYSVLINEVHDELVFDIHPRHAERDVSLIEKTMVELPTLRALVPDFKLKLKLESKRGPTWTK